MTDRVKPVKRFTLVPLKNEDHKYFGFRTVWQKGFAKHPFYKYFTVSQLMSFHVHLGGNERDIIGTSYWFLYGRRRGFVFIDLHPTILALRRMTKLITAVIKYFGKFMFVNQDRLYCWGTQRLAISIGEGYCIYSWVGGLLTNYKKIWAFYHSVLKYSDWSLLRRPKARLKFILQGLDALYGPPTLIFINCLKHASNVAAESHAVGIPAIGLVDLNSYSSDAYYLIPSNDDSVVTVGFFNDLIARLIMKTKLKRCFTFLQRKKFRETKGELWFSRQYERAVKVYNYFRDLEKRHSIYFKMPLKEWVTMNQARLTLAGLGTSIPNFVEKHVISFIFKRLRKEPVFHESKLRNLRSIEYKALFVYRKYYLQFFQKFKGNSQHIEGEISNLSKDVLRLPVKVYLVLGRVRWLYELKRRYQHLNDWFRWRLFKNWIQMKSKEGLSQKEKERWSDLLSFYDFLRTELRNLNKLYKSYLVTYYKPLQRFFYKFSKSVGLLKKDLEDNVQDELFNEIYYGKSFYHRRVKFDGFDALHKTLIRFDKMKKQLSLTPKSFGKAGLTKSTEANRSKDKIDLLMPARTKSRVVANNVNKRNFRRPWRMKDPYSWKFRRLWKPSRLEHFFYWNPYYLALLRNRPWFPKKGARYYLERPRNVRYIVFKNKVVSNLIKGNLDFFLNDPSFSIRRDFRDYVERVKKFRGVRLLNLPRRLESKSVDVYLPVKPQDLIPEKLHLFYNYWRFKMTPELLLSFFKGLEQVRKYYGKDAEFLSAFVKEALASKQVEEEMSQEECENLVEKHRSYFSMKGFSKFYSMAWGDETFSVTRTPHVTRGQAQLRTNLLNLFIRQAKAKSEFLLQKYKKGDKSISDNIKLKVLSNILTHRMLQVSWVWPYYELLSYNRIWFEKHLGLFDARPYSFSFLKPSSFGFSFIYRLLNKVTHMQRFQTTFSFVDSFLSGQLKSKVREIKVKSPLLKRLDRKLRQRQARYNSLQTTTSKSNFNKYRKQNFNKRKFKSRFKPKFRKRRSPFSRLPREQRINELKNLFPFHFWLSYYHGSRLSSVYHKQLVLSFVQQMRIVLRILYRRGALVQSNKSLLKELLNLFETMLTILVLKTGDTSFINVINRLRASNNKDKLALEKSIFYFKWLLNFIRKVSLRRRTSRYSKKLSLTYLWRFFYKNTAKAYFMPSRVMVSKNMALIDIFRQQRFFFNRDAFALLKRDVFNKFGRFHGKAHDPSFLRYVASHDDLAGIPSRPARGLLMHARSRFRYNKFKKMYVLKNSERLKGRVLLQALFNDFQYGRIQNEKHYRIIREVIFRFYYLNRQKHRVFIEMFQNNPFVDRPHLKADLDKYPGSHLFFLRNFGVRRFLKKRAFDTKDVYYFIWWFLRHKKGVPAHLRKRFIFFLRMWHNHSMFLTV